MDLQSKFGDTALIKASHFGLEKIVVKLLQAGSAKKVSMSKKTQLFRSQYEWQPYGCKNTH